MTILSVLLSVTVYSAVIFAAIMLFRIAFKKHISPKLMYLVWVILILRLLIPVTLDSGFSLIRIPTAAPEAQQALTNPPVNETGGALGMYDPGEVLTEDGSPLPAQEETAASDTTSAAAFTLDLPTVAAAIWILGMLLMLAQTIAASARLTRSLLKNSVPVPIEWLDIAEHVKRELGIHSSVRVLMVRNFVSPALNASLTPLIVMPEQMSGQSKEKIEFALRHEFTHLKRRDHLVCLLLAALRIVYWFNPIAWLASKQIKMDMETACDSAAVSPMSQEETKRYATTVLEMYAKERVRFVLGMSFGLTKKTAERRVRGIFMRKHSTPGARTAALLLAAVLLLACFTTACQPVPEEILPTDTAGITPTETVTSSVPSATPSPEVSATPAASPSVTPDPSPTASPSASASPSLAQMAALPMGIKQEARFTEDLNGDGIKEAIVVGSVTNSQTIFLYVLYAGDYNKLIVYDGRYANAFRARTSKGKFCLLVSVDEGSEDYTTFSYSFNGLKPVLQDQAHGGLVNVSGTQVTLGGHMDVIGTWDYTCQFQLENTFKLNKSSDYTILDNWMEPLHTIRELPVEMLSGGAYTPGTLPTDTTLQPTNTDGKTYLSFSLNDGSTGRILFTRGDTYEAIIGGLPESDYFDNIAYSG